MSGLADLTRRLSQLREISGILTAMKSLSLVETRKLARFMGHQRRMLENIEDAAADFLAFFPSGGVSRPTRAVVLVVGSERGFCGNFNERVLEALDALPEGASSPEFVATGIRLEAKARSRPGSWTWLPGPTVTEDVPRVLSRLMDALRAATCRIPGGPAALLALAHDAEGEIVLRRLLPFDPGTTARRPHPPRLQLSPDAFFAELLDQYLLAALFGLLYASLAAENRARLAHMERALSRLDETIAHLAIRRNALRQEKIVEEIEVILSSAQAFARRRDVSVSPNLG